MFLDLFFFSNFLFVLGVSLVLVRDFFFKNKIIFAWCCGLAFFALPLFILITGLACAYSSSCISLLLHLSPTELVSGAFVNSASFGLTLWQKSTLLACILPLVIFFNYLLTKPAHVRLASTNAVIFIVVAGMLFTLSSHLLMIFISFELLLLSSLYLLRLTAKSERIGEAVTEMFFWTLSGSMLLFIGFFILFSEGVFSVEGMRSVSKHASASSLLFLFGFGVKLPIWPCFSWLLKAHVEASVEFSILLSGVIVKFGALGVYRFVSQFGFFLHSQVLALCSTLGVVEASFRLLGQRDIKRVVALTTVIELNWIGFCVAKGGIHFEQLGAFLLIAHSFTTSSEFFLAECVYKRYNTRDFFFISGIANASPLLWVFSLLTVLVTIGFPCTSLFTAKLLFFSTLVSSSLGLFVLFMFFFLLFIPIFFIRLWVPMWFGTYKSLYFFDLTSKEITLFSFSIGGSLLIGICPSLVLDFLG